MKTVMAMAVAVMLSGCTVVTVHEKEAGGGKSSKIDGIPFYAKTELFKKTSVYSQTWLRATLTVTKKLIDQKDNKELPYGGNKLPYVKDLPKGSNPELAEIIKKIVNADIESPGTAVDIISKFRNLPAFDSSTVTPELVSNSVTSEWVVDRSKTFYLNAPRPFFGSGTLKYKLATDGTLGEGESTADSKLAEGLSTLIPLKEYLTGKFVETPSEADKAATTEGMKLQLYGVTKSMDAITGPKSRTADERDRRFVYAMELSIDEVGYEYTLTALPQPEPICDLTALKFQDIGLGKALFLRKPIGGEKKKEDKTEGKKVGISGSIEFPKDWGGGAAPKDK